MSQTVAQLVSGSVTTPLAPPGSVVFVAQNTPPTGWLKANGAQISRTVYSELFAAIGTTFGAGDGSTTFTLPDLRGEFPRGWDDSRGIDSGRAFGSGQVDDYKAHSHTVSGVPQGASLDGANSGGAVGVFNFSTTSTLTSSVSPGAGGTETRPRNIALLACIKF